MVIKTCGNQLKIKNDKLKMKGFETTYLVTKETVVYRQCPDCTGGYNIRQFAGERMKVICTACKGSMKKKITHRTEVSLEEALRERGMMIND
jgi:Zn finger protein HypA/HybF involved in hydrogenase expression